MNQISKRGIRICNQALFARFAQPKRTYYQLKTNSYFDRQSSDKGMLSMVSRSAFATREGLSPSEEDDLKRADEFDVSSMISQKTSSNIQIAIDYLQQAYDIRLAILGEEDPKTYTTFANIAFLYFRKQDFKTAGKMLLECHDKANNLFGSESPEALRTLDELGNLYEAVGQLDDSLEVKSRALEIVKTTPNIPDEDFGRMHISFGKTLLHAGYLDDALRHLMEGLTFILQVFGQANPLLLGAYNNLALCHLRKGSFKTALSYGLNANEVSKKLFEGDYTSEMVVLWNTLGQIYDSINDFETSLEYKQRALTAAKELFGENHSTIAATLNNIAHSYQKMNDIESALSYFNKSLSLYQKINTKEHHDYINVLNSVGNIYLVKKDYEKAVQTFENSIELAKKLNKGYEKTLAESLQKMGQACLLSNKPAKALLYLNQALPKYIETMTETHRETANLYHLIANAYSKNNQHKEALETHQKTLAIRQKIFGKDHPEVGTSCYFVASEFFKLDNYTQALEYSKRALDIYLKNYGESHNSIKKIKQLHNISTRIVQDNSSSKN